MTQTESEPWSQEDATRFGEVLAGLRRPTRLSQRALARLSRVSQSTVAALESGKRSDRHSPVKPTAETIGKLSRGLAIDPRDETTVSETRAAEFHQKLMLAAGYGPTGRPEIPKFQSPIPEGVSIDDLSDVDVEKALEAYDRYEGVGSAYAGGGRDWRSLSPTGRRLVLESREQARLYNERIEAAEQEARARGRS